MKDEIAFIETFFRNLETKDIRFCILRNADEVKRGDAHDIDMAIDCKRIKEVFELLNSLADKFGWKIHIMTGLTSDLNHLKCVHLYNIDSKIIHIDLFCTFIWKGMVLIGNDVLLQDINSNDIYHKSNDSITAVTQLFIRLLHNGYIKEKYMPNILACFKQNPEKVRILMQNFMTTKMSDYVYTCVVGERWKDIESIRKTIINDICLTLKNRSLLSFSLNKFRYIRFLFNKIKQKSGIMIVFEGTDGSGKSTIIEKLSQRLGNSFNEELTLNYHWRPGFIKSPKKGSTDTTPITDPHKHKPYTKIISLGKFMFFNLDYILGYWILIRANLSKGRMVVFDRYYYDYYLDKYRYRLDISDCIIDLFKILIPKPDVTFLLVGDPAVVYERKKEISIEEVVQQIDRLHKSKDKFNNSIIIDVNKSIEEVVSNVSISILNTLYNRRFKV